MTRSVPDGNPAIFPGSPVNVSSPGAIATSFAMPKSRIFTRRRRQVAMDDAFLVCGGQPAHDLSA
jgi:hypothetical protein